MTLGIKQTTVKIPVTKIHPRTPNQQAIARCGMTSPWPLSVLVRGGDSLYLLVSLSPINSQQSLSSHCMHASLLPPSACQSCLYLKLRELHTWFNLVNQISLVENSGMKWSLGWTDKPAGALVDRMEETSQFLFHPCTHLLIGIVLLMYNYLGKDISNTLNTKPTKRWKL